MLSRPSRTDPSITYDCEPAERNLCIAAETAARQADRAVSSGCLIISELRITSLDHQSLSSQNPCPSYLSLSSSLPPSKVARSPARLTTQIDSSRPDKQDTTQQAIQGQTALYSTPLLGLRGLSFLDCQQQARLKGQDCDSGWLFVFIKRRRHHTTSIYHTSKG
jgi:hypothetical protein